MAVISVQGLDPATDADQLRRRIGFQLHVALVVGTAAFGAIGLALTSLIATSRAAKGTGLIAAIPPLGLTRRDGSSTDPSWPRPLLARRYLAPHVPRPHRRPPRPRRHRR